MPLSLGALLESGALCQAQQPIREGDGKERAGYFILPRSDTRGHKKGGFITGKGEGSSLEGRRSF